MSSAFAAPLRRFYRESAWLLGAYQSAVRKYSMAFHREYELAADMAVVRLHDSWARFCREAVILSACGRTQTLSGTVVSSATGISGRRDVIPKLLSTYSRPRFEPRWHIAHECLDAAKRLQVSNMQSLHALGATGSPSEELRHLRNYIAHRNADTATKVQLSPGLAGLGTHKSIGLSRFVNGGVSQLESWVIDLRAIAKASLW